MHTWTHRHTHMIEHIHTNTNNRTEDVIPRMNLVLLSPAGHHSFVSELTVNFNQLNLLWDLQHCCEVMEPLRTITHPHAHTRSAPHKQFATCNVVSIRPDTRQMLLLFGHFNVLADSPTSWATSKIPLPPLPDWRLMAAGAFREDQQQICYRRWHVAMMDSQQTADRPS